MGAVAVDPALGVVSVGIEAELARALLRAVGGLQARPLLAGGVRGVCALAGGLGALVEEQAIGAQLGHGHVILALCVGVALFARGEPSVGRGTLG